MKLIVNNLYNYQNVQLLWLLWIAGQLLLGKLKLRLLILDALSNEAMKNLNGCEFIDFL